jgi:hypothetical protein
MIPSMFGVICDNEFQGQKGREKAMGFYLRHYERVRRVVPKEMLLEYSIQEGCEPLGKFLYGTMIYIRMLQPY